MDCYTTVASNWSEDHQELYSNNDYIVLEEIIQNNGSGNCSAELGDPLSISDWALVTLFCSIIAVCVVGNTLVIAAVFTTRRLRTVTNYFVTNLALADWTVGCLVMPPKLLLYLTNNKWPFGYIICELWISLDILLCTASILSLLTISIDRYLAITRPLAYSRKRRSKRLALSMISCVWVAAVIITSPPFFGWYAPNRNADSCEYNENPSYVIYSACGSFFLPLSLMIYVYARIACVITKRQKTISRIKNRSGATVTDDIGNNGQSLAMSSFPGPDSGHNPGDDDEYENSSLGGPHPGHPGPVVQGQGSPEEIEGNPDKNSKNLRFLCCCCSDQSGCPRETQTTARSKFKESGRLSCQLSQKRESSVKQEKNKNPAQRSILRRTFPGGRSQTPKSSHLGNGNSLITGSRLCHHHISTESPEQRVRRVQSANSARIFTDQLANSRSQNGLPGGPRIWTVESMSKKVSIELSEDQQQEEKSQKNAKNTKNDHNLNKTNSSGSTSSSSSQMVEKRASILSQKNRKFGESLSISSGTKVQIKMPTTRLSSGGSLKYFAKDLNSGSGRIASFRRETKTAQTLFFIIFGFVCCWLPFFIVYIMSPFIETFHVPIEIYDGLIWLGWSNSSINPFIYAFYSIDFRNAFWRLTLGRFEGGFNCFRRDKYGHQSRIKSPDRDKIIAIPIGGLRANLPNKPTLTNIQSIN